MAETTLHLSLAASGPVDESKAREILDGFRRAADQLIALGVTVHYSGGTDPELPAEPEPVNTTREVVTPTNPEPPAPPKEPEPPAPDATTPTS